MRRRIILLIIIISMCVIVGVGGILTFLNSDSVFKGAKKINSVDTRGIAAANVESGRSIHK